MLRIDRGGGRTARTATLQAPPCRLAFSKDSIAWSRRVETGMNYKFAYW